MFRRGKFLFEWKTIQNFIFIVNLLWTIMGSQIKTLNYFVLGLNEFIFFFIIAIQISNEISFPNNVLNFQMEHSVSRCWNINISLSLDSE